MTEPRYSVTERFLTDYAELYAYWRDPSPFEVERRAEQDKLNAPYRARVKADNEARWAKEA